MSRGSASAITRGNQRVQDVPAVGAVPILSNECGYCNFKGANRDEKLSHIRLVHGFAERIPDFRCVCGKKLVKASAISVHVLKHRKEEMNPRNRMGEGASPINRVAVLSG